MSPTDRQLVTRIARRYPTYYLRGYARGKLRSDPVYEAVRVRLDGSELPVLDIGCGIGLCALYLREHGFTAPITGIDPDASKITAAQRVAGDDAGLAFEARDGAETLPVNGHVLILDVLHYFQPDVRRQVLERLASQIPAGGWCIIRATPADGSWRFRCTQWEERFAHAIRWMRRPVVAFPRREEVVAPFEAAGFACEVRPLWGRTPFNSYLFAFRR
ncbi:MAG: class I SAM-dependent methyltransferase [Phycisphaeraceae bacterium]